MEKSQEGAPLTHTGTILLLLCLRQPPAIDPGWRFALTAQDGDKPDCLANSDCDHPLFSMLPNSQFTKVVFTIDNILYAFLFAMASNKFALDKRLIRCYKQITQLRKIITRRSKAMEETKQKKAPKPYERAIPQGLSLYPYQIQWLQKRADERSLRASEANASKVVQDLIDEAMKKEQGKK